MSNFEKIQIRITEYKQILQFIKENFPFICIYFSILAFLFSLVLFLVMYSGLKLIGRWKNV